MNLPQPVKGQVVDGLNGKPVFIRKDSRGVPIRVGQRVAYNRSGDVITGVVVSANSGSTIIMPDIEFQSAWRSNHGRSRVKNATSILVLEDA